MSLKSAVAAWSFAILLSAPAFADQTVVLDFDTYTDAVSDDGKDHVYSPAERSAIVGIMNDKFAGFPVAFTDVAPAMGLYSTVYFNVGLSDSGDVDFQNIKKIDDASIHIPKLLEIASVPEPFSGPDMITASVNIAAHETLHLLGARHHDSFAPIGGGTPAPGISDDFDPVYPGPPLATLASSDFMSLTTSIGFSAGKLLDPSLFIGPRTGMKLLLDTVDVDVDSADSHDPTMPQGLMLTTIPVPNKIPMAPGSPEMLFFADVAIVEEATIETTPGPGPAVPVSDYYEFFAKEGDFMTIEMISKIIDYRLSDTLDTRLWVLDPTTGYSPVPYYTGPALNNDERESTDSMILDLVIPHTGHYVIEAGGNFGPGVDNSGEYELLVYRINTVIVPEPSGMLLGLLGVATLGFVTARKRPMRRRPSH